MVSSPEQPIDRDQPQSQPKYLSDYVPKDHLVRLLAATVDALDPSDGTLRPVPTLGGEPEYDVRLLAAAWLYGFFEGVDSSRVLADRASAYIPLMWLLAMQKPDRDTLACFLEANREGLRELFRTAAFAAAKLGMVDLELRPTYEARAAFAARQYKLQRRERRTLHESVNRVVDSIQR